MTISPTDRAKKRTKSEQEELWRKQEEDRELQSVRFFLIGLAMTPGQVALSAMGAGGPVVIGVSSLALFVTLATALFYRKIAFTYPKIRSRFRSVVRPQAFLALVVLFASISWLTDASIRWNVAAVPSGSFLSPEAKSQEAAKLPLIPTHARLEFPVNIGRAIPAGQQENIWNWMSTNSSVTPFGFNRPPPELSAWSITIVFTNPTSVDAITVHTLNTPGRPLPPYTFLSKDSRTAFVQFHGDLSGFIIDITNQP